MSTTRKVMRGEVYYIKSFPTVGHEQRSGRPAVIVSNNENNAHSGTYEICYMTLQDKPKLPTHVFIDRGPCINSTILCEQITTVAEDKLGDFMCRIPEHLDNELDKALAVSLGLRLTQTNSDKSPNQSIVDERNALRTENAVLIHKLESANKALEDLDIVQSKADMYERMYNDLLDRLVKRA